MNKTKINKLITLSMFLTAQSFIYAADDNDTLIMSDLMSMDFEELMEVEITSSTKTPRKLSQAPSTVNAYLAEDIHKLGARSVSDILWLVAGIQSQVKHNNRKKIWIRGVQSEFNNKIALYIDGVPYRDVFGGFSIDEEIPIESIKRIEIIRGPGSALYGANAFSGVINIFTFNPSDTQENRVKLGLGSQNTKLGYFAVRDNLNENFKFMLEAKELKTNGRKPEYNQQGIENYRSGKQSLDYLKFQTLAYEDLLFSISYSQFDNFRVDKAINRDDGRNNDNLRISLSYNNKFSDKLSMNSNLYHTKVTRVEYDHNFELVDEGKGVLKESYDFTDSTSITGLNLNLNYHLTGTNELVGGIDIKDESLDESSFIDNFTNLTNTFIEDERYKNISLLDYGLFLQDTQSFNNDKTNLTVGLRFDKLDIFKDQFNYRIGLNHSFNSKISAKLLYGTAYRSPNFIEFVRAPKDSALPDVETLKTIEAQIAYQSKKNRISLTLFRNDYQDFIYRKNSFHEAPENLRAGVFGNIDNQEINGVELESQYIFNKNFSGFLNLSWIDAKSSILDKPIPLLANWTASTGIDWRKKIAGGEFLFHNELIVYGDREDWPNSIWDEGVEPRYPNRDDDFSDGFAKINSGVHYKFDFNNHTIELDLTIHNLLDTTYYTQSITVPRSNRAAYFDTEYPNRHIRFNINYKW